MKFIDSPYRKVLVPEIDEIRDPLRDLARHFQLTRERFSGTPESKAAFRHAERKWSVAELLGHLIDTQVIWLYRILWMARGEKRSCAYADENLWTQNAGYNQIPLKEIADRYGRLSVSTEMLLLGIPEASYRAIGDVNGVEMTVMEGVMTLIAHERHHLRILQERYSV